ncbi:MAG TPA: GNAT family N-acetyltransferase [Caulobacteraceae bacterium]
MSLAAEPLLAPVRTDARAPARAAFTVETVETREAFAALQPEWDRLAERASITPMARHDWLLAAVDAFTWRRLAVVTVRDPAGTLRAAAPFAVTQFGPFQRLVWLSHEMGEPQTLLYDDADSLEALVRAAADLRLPLAARRLTPKDGELASVERILARRGMCSLRSGTTRTTAAHVRDWAAFEAGMSGNSRSEMRRKRRGLEKHGPVAFHAISPEPEAVDGWLDELLRVESSGWKGREKSAIVFRPQLARFVGDYAQRAAANGTLRLFFLSLNGESIAAQMLAETGGRLWQFKIGYDERWSRYSPGRLLMFDILRWASERGLDAVEYLGHGGGWQSRWPAVHTDHTSLRFYPATLSGAAAFVVDTAEFVRRKLDPARAGDPPKKAAAAEEPAA